MKIRVIKQSKVLKRNYASRLIIFVVFKIKLIKLLNLKLKLTDCSQTLVTNKNLKNIMLVNLSINNTFEKIFASIQYI